MASTRTRAALGSVLFFFAAPGVVAGLIPWALTGWHRPDRAIAWRITGWAAIIAGLLVLVAAFAQFVLEGRGTPAPVAPTEQLVVRGLYRWVRNPMYLAVAATLLGQAALFGSVAVLVEVVLFGVAVWTFVTGYEQPTLRSRYGDQYANYCANVPGWWPRLTPWRAPG